jgi:hypothetical protein
VPDIASAPRYDPFADSFQLDPYPAYRELRDHDPVHRHCDPPFWALSRFDDIWHAVRDSGSFSSAQGLTFYPDEIGTLGLAPTLVMLDPPRHGQLRALVSKGFTARRVTDLEELIREFARQRIAELERRVADHEPVDLHRDYSAAIPNFVIAHLLGVPQADRVRFNPWVSALTCLQNNGFQVDTQTAIESVAEMFGYFSEVITARRADPALIPNALLEFLRLESSVQALARTTLRPVTLHGVRIPEGEKVLMLYGSANHDEREFGGDADRLDITRSIPRHLAFSSGVHFCIGSHLARLQARVALEELLARQPTVGVDLSRAQRLRSPFTRGWVSLPATGITPG